MADVYCAEDTHLGRQVALKVLHRRFAAGRGVRGALPPRGPVRRRASSTRTSSASSTAASTTAPTTSRWSTSRAARSRSWSSSEAPLDQAERDRPRRSRSCAAARFAHKRGVVHRDFKPHNVIVDDDGRGEGHGLRHRPRRRVGDDARPARSWAPPSTCRPSRPRASGSSAQSDLYSIGIILYELLTGQRAVRRRERRVDRAEARERGRRRRPPARPDGHAGARGRRHARAREGPGGALRATPTSSSRALEEARAALGGPAPVGQRHRRARRGRSRPPATDGLPTAARGGQRAASRRLAAGGRARPARSSWSRWRRCCSSGRQRQVDVPNVVGPAARGGRRQRWRTRASRSTSNGVPDRARGQVIGQDPPAATKADEGSTVDLTVSSGPGRPRSDRDASRRSGPQELTGAGCGDRK